MALGDYILCSKCECKLVYDGNRDMRDWLEERFQTRSLMCPDCLDALKAELQQRALECMSLDAQNMELAAERDALKAQPPEGFVLVPIERLATVASLLENSYWRPEDLKRGAGAKVNHPMQAEFDDYEKNCETAWEFIKEFAAAPKPKEKENDYHYSQSHS